MNLSNLDVSEKGGAYTDDNQMILGVNNVNVGIGLSNDNANGLAYVGPGNKLEINAGQYGANTFERPSAGDPAFSGLRFRDMTEICGTEPNEGLGVLSVNEEGDIIYIEAIGNYCTETPRRPLRANYEIPLDNGQSGFNYNFTGQIAGTSNVIVGNTSACLDAYPWAKLQGLQNTTQASGLNGGK